jgi:hypothetical protein
MAPEVVVGIPFLFASFGVRAAMVLAADDERVS